MVKEDLDRVRGEIQQSTFARDYQAKNPFMIDLFESSSDSIWSVLPDANLRSAVYVADPDYYRSKYTPPKIDTLENFKNLCRRRENGEFAESFDEELKKDLRSCPSSVSSIEALCNTDRSCQIDAIYLQAKALGAKNKDEYQSLENELSSVLQKYNSCGAISLEYPEFMRKEPKSSAPAYLEDHHASFSCYQDHVSKGDMEYHCRKEVSAHDSNFYIMRWNSGGQPYCQPRQLNNFLTWIFWIGIVLGIIMLLVIVFACCWSVKQRHIKKIRTRRNSVASMPKTEIRRDSLAEMEPLREPVRYEKNVKRHSPSSSLNDTFSNPERSQIQFGRSNSQPYLYNDHVPQYAMPRPLNGAAPMQPRRPSYSGLSGLSTGV